MRVRLRGWGSAAFVWMLLLDLASPARADVTIGGTLRINDGTALVAWCTNGHIVNGTSTWTINGTLRIG